MISKSFFQNIFLLTIILIFGLFTLESCSTTRKLTDDQALVHKVKVKTKKSTLKDNSQSFIRQKPNKKVLGIGWLKFYLGIYYAFDWKNENKVSKWLKNRIGEAPVIYDSAITQFSAQQMQMLYFNNGYFDATVTPEVNIKNKKAKIYYHIKPEQAYRIRNIQYQIKDTNIRSIYFYNLQYSKIKLDDIFNQDLLQAERERIVKDIKNNGYFFFNREFIYFNIDTSIKDNFIDLKVVIENPEGKTAHPFYRINNVNIDIIDPESKVVGSKIFYDSVSNYTFNDPARIIKSKVLKRMIFLDKNSLYKDQDLELTYNRLGDLKIFRFINIDFEVDSLDSTKINSRITLTQGKRRGTQTEIEGFVASENIGSSANLLYTDRNIFRGAEVLEFRIKAGLETQAFIDENAQNIPIFNSRESNTSLSVTFPGFLFFRDKKTFGLYSSPKTRVGINYITERRPEYLRRTFTGALTYDWKQNQYLTHSLTPYSINFVRSELSDEALTLLNNLDNQFIKESFEPHITQGIRYNLTYSNQVLNLKKDYIFFRLNLEVMGTGLYGISRILDDNSNVRGTYTYFDLPYYNFTRPEIDFRYFNFIGQKSQLVYRFNTGVGFAYWNSDVLPFERQFFTGGSNSIRAFRARTIGPGAFSDIDASALNLDQTGEMKIEGNIEFRFDLLESFIGSKLKGATFIDFGNVWTISDVTVNKDGQFYWDKFYSQLAVGTGFGMRFDYSFLLFRLDLGLKLRDPRFSDSERWVIKNLNDDQWKSNNQYNFWNFNFGIGYPF